MNENDKEGRFSSSVILELFLKNPFPCLSYSGLIRVSIIFMSPPSFMDLRIKSEDDREERFSSPVNEDD